MSSSAATPAVAAPDFDRWLRPDEETEYSRQYVRNNPVKAGLGHRQEYYP